ncbi:hypothetical protein CfE428DRAFT_1873 [Chthoniobacter flavus Ellin428]|uniref:Lipoprotein n=1 Tax=Chthoniobacter flavus Ellin428 TaxID=497964 RepID=B4CYY5_9BACT|nr:hypothetical protein [Chthoniobacter flavus]EDY20676.1 hypothetical protein CfE428DRAFT_1873 [Chthoniobacter flavus Ellin428]TCO89575.1 hypothetical protein EV701_11311 [Chthoniobacter flavus]
MHKAILPLIALLCCLAGCVTESSSSAPEAWHVDLRYAFDHERVVVSANGRQVFSGSVTTNDGTGLAKGISIRNQWDLLHLRIEVPSTGIVLERTLDARQGRFVGVTKQFDGELSMDQQTTDFSRN